MPFSPQLTEYFPLIMGVDPLGVINLAWVVGLLLFVAIDLWLGKERKAVSPGWLWRPLAMGIGAVFALIFLWRAWALPAGLARINLPGPPNQSLLVVGNGVYGPELGGFWVAPDRECSGYYEIGESLETLAFQGHSLVDNSLEIIMGQDSRDIDLPASKIEKFEMSPGRPFLRGRFRYYKFKARAKTGVVPKDLDLGSDERNLGVFLKSQRPQCQGMEKSHG